MNRTRLVLRSLRRDWKTDAVVALGIALSTTVVCGSLLVGTSFSRSVRRTLLHRLGRVDHALQAPRFFRAALAEAFSAPAAGDTGAPRAVAMLDLEGTVRCLDTDLRVPNVRVLGIDAGFAHLFDRDPLPADIRHGCAINTALAEALNLATGDFVRVSVPRRDVAPGDALFARRARHERVSGLRLEVLAILPDRGAGGFSTARQTLPPRNLFVDRARLARAIDAPDQINRILFRGGSGSAEWQSILNARTDLADHGLDWRPHADPATISLYSQRLTLEPQQVDAVRAVAAAIGAHTARTSIYLADTLRTPGGSAAYAVLAGIEDLARLPVDMTEPGQLGPRDILLNTWLAEDLQARPGDPVEVEYRRPAPDGGYRPQRAVFTLRGIVALEDLAADPALTPEFRGITDADTIGNWDPPFPVDLARVTTRDEEYWTRYRATPKAFVSTDAIRAFWHPGDPPDAPSGKPWVTSIRLRLPAGRSGEDARTRFEARFREVLPADRAGLKVRPVRRLALAAAPDAGEFGMLFLAMGLFILASALGLAAMLMRLRVRQRAPEFGLLLTCGFDPRRTSRLVRTECAFLSLAGIPAGTLLGLGYANAILARLHAGPFGHGGTVELHLHVSAAALAGGALAGTLCAAAAARWAAREFRHVPIPRLLAGGPRLTERHGNRRVPAANLLAATGLAAAVAFGLHGGGMAAFFGAGLAVLTAGLAGARIALAHCAHRAMTPDHTRFAVTTLALKNAAMHPARSLLCIALPAAATFILTTVSALYRDPGAPEPDRPGAGAAGWTLRATAAIPPPVDFDSAEGRKHLGFSAAEEALFEGVRILALPATAGDDISCLNPAATDTPRILGAPRELFERREWIPRLEQPGHTPWSALNAPVPDDGDLPVFGDAESIQWQLQSGLGERITVQGPDGSPLQLRVAGLLPPGIFAGELLIAETHFRRLFPSLDRPRFFLIETPPERTGAVAETLRRRLGDLGLDVVPTGDILREIATVQNTYLAAFMALGGLGALLGSFGMVIVLLRNALERRGEFALMRAIGFPRRWTAELLIRENTLLLLAGLLCGLAAALPAVAHQWRVHGTPIHWRMLGIVLGGMLAANLSAGALAALHAVRGNALRALREEHT